MFREIRLKNQLLSQEETTKILKEMTHGTLAINDANGYPYSIPVSFVFAGDKIYFHGATEGQKHDLLKKDGRVSFSVVALDDVQPKQFTTFYKSVIAYGTVRILEEPAEMQKVMERIVEKYSAGYMEEGKTFIQAQQGNFCVYELTVEHITGKQSE